MSMMLGGIAGSMNVVEDVATTVVEVDVVDDVGRPAGVVAGTVSGGMHNGCGLVELGAGVELGGALAVASEARAIERVPTATVASSRTATTRPPSSRRPKASAATPVNRASEPTSSTAPGEPPEAGRLQSLSIGVGSREG